MVAGCAGQSDHWVWAWDSQVVTEVQWGGCCGWNEVKGQSSGWSDQRCLRPPATGLHGHVKGFGFDSEWDGSHQRFQRPEQTYFFCLVGWFCFCFFTFFIFPFAWNNSYSLHHLPKKETMIKHSKLQLALLEYWSVNLYVVMTWLEWFKLLERERCRTHQNPFSVCKSKAASGTIIKLD